VGQSNVKGACMCKLHLNEIRAVEFNIYSSAYIELSFCALTCNKITVYS
jgi:hypothetical protein